MKGCKVREQFPSKCTMLSSKDFVSKCLLDRWACSVSYSCTRILVKQQTESKQTRCKRITQWPATWWADTVSHNHLQSYAKFGKERKYNRPQESYAHRKHRGNVNTVQHKRCECWQNAALLLGDQLASTAKLVPFPSPSLPQTLSIQSQTAMIIKNNEYVWRKQTCLDYQRFIKYLALDP